MNAELLSRPSVPAMDAMLGYSYPVLDKGFIRLIDYMGDEAAIVQAARVSYGTGTKATSEDRGLLRYLMRHRHSTPFEMAEIKVHVKLPVFVARQWIRHRTANVNEYSARYSILEREFYVPALSDIAQQSDTNAQGRALQPLTEADAKFVQEKITEAGEYAFDLYDMMTYSEVEPESDSGLNIARETARIVTPVSTYTQWYWKVNAHNFMHFLSLRADPHAQMEIRVYADVLLRMLETWMPNVWQAFMDYRVNAKTFSAQEMVVIRSALASYPGAFDNIAHAAGRRTDISAREKAAFLTNLRGTEYV